MKKKLHLVITVAVLGTFALAYFLIPKSYGIYQDAVMLAQHDDVVRAPQRRATTVTTAGLHMPG